MACGVQGYDHTGMALVELLSTCRVSPRRPHLRNGALDLRRCPIGRERYSPVRLGTSQPIEHKGVQAIHDICAQSLHFLVTDPAYPVPRDLAIGANDFQASITASATFGHSA